jgi:hypothetical protein
VGVASAAALAALWPAMVRRAFSDEACAESPLARLAQVVASFRRARASGKPLLVFVIPAAPEARWERGETFGELLNHGADRDLAPLAAAEVVCATMEDLRRIVPSAGAGEPLMVLVHPERLPATARQLDTALAPRSSPFEEGMSWQEVERREDEASDKRIAAMGEMLRRALGDDERRAASLAVEVRARLKDKPPAGTRWATGAGCGFSIEGEEDKWGMACGMGHVPKKARRFLYFFTGNRGI